MADQTNVVKGRLVLFDDGTLNPATITIQDGKILKVICEYQENSFDGSEVIDAGGNILMPGIIDSHVHINEPGRTAWEGFETATQSAAAGGITTIIDMPLNSIPPTTTVPNFQEKVSHAQRQCYIDVGFWGGVVPGNELQIKPLIRAGVVGFKCFLIHSGVDEFPHVTESDLHSAMRQLQGSDSVLLFHAEVEVPSDNQEDGDPAEYETFVKSRPPSMELEAIRLVCKLCLQYRVRCHIVHLSASSALPLIERVRDAGAPLTVETCHHYLSLHAEDIPNGATQFKCCPPIRNRYNQEELWKAVKSGLIDLVISDHSPCTADLKLFEKCDFMQAWGGIGGLQFGLPLFWTSASRRGLGLADLSNVMIKGPAKLCKLDKRKGAIKPGYDADFVIWDPHASFKVKKEDIYFKNKVSPYIGMDLQGVIKKTIVAGEVVWDNARRQFSATPKGKLLI